MLMNARGDQWAAGEKNADRDRNIEILRFSDTTYLLTNISEFCKEEIGFRIILYIFPPRVRLWHEAWSNSMNGFKRLEFALAHMLPSCT